MAERRHLNRGGVVHGGMVMTFADQALGLAAWAANGDRPQVTIQLDTHFISSVQAGEFVEARCRVVRKTNALLFMQGDLAVGDRLVATAMGVWKMRRGRPGGA
ncbi:PaaI family thioesterase [uncultured Enterovirga sp.]|uniref:PaaI family thioesterase n=1 Tax=uncultured Enterovirga sp. TaxID=2026352 RepID=UPI0035CB7575